MRQLEGIIPVVQTPLLSGVDEDGLARLVESLVDAGVGGLWALGTGSEDMCLSGTDHVTAARVIADANRGRLPLIVGLGNMPFSVADLTADYAIDAYHWMPPHHPLGWNAWLSAYTELAEIVGKPLWAYSSANWSQPMPPWFVAKLKEIPNICGVKYSTTKTTDMLDVLELADEKFQVISAVAPQFLTCLQMGFKASTTSWAGALPEPFVTIHQRFKAGMFAAAKEEQRKFNRFLKRIPPRPKAWNFLTGAHEKHILKRKGICEPRMTAYFTELTEAEQQEMDALLEEFGYG